ncbi:MAG: recombinase family protein, partial [Lachnospiraceae bacterium]|nr:recombinase family protein [Lachnospiraceae bacterium]
NTRLDKLQRKRRKYMDMYADDLISREELNQEIGGVRREIERLEQELQMVSYHLTKGEQLETILNHTFQEIEDISDVHQMTNRQLREIVQKIEVDKEGNVDIFLRLFGDLGLDEAVLIEHTSNMIENTPNMTENTSNITEKTSKMDDNIPSMATGNIVPNSDDRT